MNEVSITFEISFISLKLGQLYFPTKDPWSKLSSSGYPSINPCSFLYFWSTKPSSHHSVLIKNKYLSKQTKRVLVLKISSNWTQKFLPNKKGKKKPNSVHKKPKQTEGNVKKKSSLQAFLYKLGTMHRRCDPALSCHLDPALNDAF